MEYSDAIKINARARGICSFRLLAKAKFSSVLSEEMPLLSSKSVDGRRSFRSDLHRIKVKTTLTISGMILFKCTSKRRTQNFPSKISKTEKDKEKSEMHTKQNKVFLVLSRSCRLRTGKAMLPRRSTAKARIRKFSARIKNVRHILEKFLSKWGESLPPSAHVM